MNTEGPDILLVEDDSDDIDLALQALRTKKIMATIEVVRDGVEALDFLFRTGAYADRPPNSDPKVVWLNLKLPRVDGLQVLQRIKGDPRLQTMPVVMLTSSHEECDIVASYYLGVNSYIVKPVDLDQFTDAVRAAGMYWLVLNRQSAQYGSVAGAPPAAEGGPAGAG